MFLGKNGFVWWIGVVEDNVDPLNLCRAKVRIFGYHPDYASNKVPTQDLPWAVTIHSTNTPDSHLRPGLGEWVFGFFLDANEAQEPAILGYIPGIPSLPRTQSFGRYDTTTRSFSKVNQSLNVGNTGYVMQFSNSTFSIANTGNLEISTSNNFITNSKRDILATSNNSILRANTITIVTSNNQFSMASNGNVILTSNGLISLRNSTNSTINMSPNGEINITRGSANIKMGANGAITLFTNTDIFLSSSLYPSAGTFGLINRILLNDGINAYQNTQIEEAKELPLPPLP